MKRKTKIVVTLGPSLEEYSVLKEVFKVANVARFNFSHGNHNYHGNMLKMIQEIEEELNRPITTMADTKGPEVRTLNKDSFEIVKGEKYAISDFSFSPRDAIEQLLETNDVVYLDDGKLIFRYDGEGLVALTGGVLSPYRGVIVKGKDFDLPSITDKDKEDLIFIKSRFDAVAQSFVRKAQDIFSLRELVGDDIITVAKIETKSATENYKEIISAYDGVMVARGDLALSIPLEELPSLQKKIVSEAKNQLKFSIVATQMLESMVESPFPLRSEVTDVYNAVLIGADGIMLSGETSKGKYPVETVKIMRSLAQKAEQDLSLENRHLDNVLEHFGEYKNIISFSAVNMASVLKSNIIAPTVHGTTPRKLSRLRTSADIFTITPNQKTLKLLNFYYAVFPKLGDFEPLFERFEELKALFKQEKAIFVFGYPPGNHRTNTVIYI